MHILLALLVYLTPPIAFLLKAFLLGFSNMVLLTVHSAYLHAVVNILAPATVKCGIQTLALFLRAIIHSHSFSYNSKGLFSRSIFKKTLVLMNVNRQSFLKVFFCIMLKRDSLFMFLLPASHPTKNRSQSLVSQLLKMFEILQIYFSFSHLRLTTQF